MNYYLYLYNGLEINTGKYSEDKVKTELERSIRKLRWN